MDIIELNSYTFDEKLHIFNQHLFNKVLAQTGLNADQVIIPDSTIHLLINNYCREPGVRSLYKFLTKIAEKVAYQIVTMNKKNVTVQEKDLILMLGQHIFGEDNLYGKSTPVGVSCGLAYTDYGGGLVYVESINNSQGQKLQVTGQLGNVMKESTQIAFTFIQKFLNELMIEHKCSLIEQKHLDFLNKQNIHIHFPQGGIPKDGPSAGITIASSLISLVLQQPLDPNIAMTGELTLNGQVLKIGGVKEKVLAAQREGINKLIFPFSNQQDVQILDSNITKNIQFYYVSNYLQVFQIVFNSKITI